MKKYEHIENWDLIAKYYSNECNQKETDELFQWVRQSKENEELFNNVKKDLELININKSMNKVNVDSAWDKLRNRILDDEVEVNIPEKTTKLWNFNRVLRYAAMIIIIAGIGITVGKLYNSNPLIEEYTDNTEQDKEIILPDGTKVFLNADSYLAYPDQFASNERRVKLKGEAFFDVTKNQKKPFIIESNNAEVKVLGTSFNVNAKLPDNEIQVYVKTGLVQLSRKNNIEEKVLINPGDLGKLTAEKVEKIKNEDPNILSWKTKEIVFIENNIAEVIYVLNKTYNINIQCDDENILELKYTSTFRNQKIDSILNVICTTHNLKTINTEEGIKLVRYSY